MSAIPGMGTTSEGVWALAARRLRGDRVGMTAIAVVLLYALLVLAAVTGLAGAHWQQERGVSYAPPTLLGPAPQALPMPGLPAPAASAPLLDLSSVDPLAPRYREWDEATARQSVETTQLAETLPLGGDRLGRSVLDKAIKGSQISILVGVLAAVVAAAIGTVLGALAGFLGGRVGDLLEWVYNVFTSIPGILLIFAFAAVAGRGVTSVVLILGLTGWTGMYRQVRAEFIKHSSREYVRSAEAIGATRMSRMFRHILPNVSHLLLVQFSILTVALIKYEAILSFLGFGVSVTQTSWGAMLAEAPSELLQGYWWQMAAVTLCMSVLVTAFSMLTDSLRDALDPKLK